MLLDISGEEMAPKAEHITENSMKTLRENGLGVRAWGVFNIPLMKKMCPLKVDDMTVNFPDRLFQLLNQALLNLAMLFLLRLKQRGVICFV